MEKILIKENTIRHSDALEEINETIQIINTEYREMLKELGIEVLTFEIFDDCFKNSAARLKKSFYQAVEKDLQSIKTETIRKSLFLDAKKAFNLFINQFNKIKPNLKHVDFLSIEKNTCTLTPENKNNLFESLNTYISDPEQIEAYNRHQAAAKALNVFFNGKHPLYWHNLFVFENGEFKPNENTNYLSFINHGTVK